MGGTPALSVFLQFWVPMWRFSVKPTRGSRVIRGYERWLQVVFEPVHPVVVLQLLLGLFHNYDAVLAERYGRDQPPVSGMKCMSG
jgi:hypothetical protein